jgi:hypothetical protein
VCLSCRTTQIQHKKLQNSKRYISTVKSAPATICRTIRSNSRKTTSTLIPVAFVEGWHGLRRISNESSISATSRKLKTVGFGRANTRMQNHHENVGVSTMVKPAWADFRSCVLCAAKSAKSTKSSCRLASVDNGQTTQPGHTCQKLGDENQSHLTVCVSNQFCLETMSQLINQ